MSTQQETLAERLARVLRRGPVGGLSQEESELRLVLWALMDDGSAMRVEHADFVLHLLYRWLNEERLLPVLREAARELQSHLDECEPSEDNIRDSWRYEGLHDARDTFRDAFKRHGLPWPKEPLGRQGLTTRWQISRDTLGPWLAEGEKR